ncbi:uncharacterized protein IL334_002753 [Kwoniella shivajii]|uniref:Small nuclear ribonucleoprotein Prp3 C-terminal domain-containing protein n=1 Tax=Kwoniella shivajii TaxID=564305 RepID=A0ABZ1CWX0_9TREE|nr:hypothetical protein IL334_002753 [Kwoniella shivajii]
MSVLTPEGEAQLDLLQLLTSMYTSTELHLPETTQSILDTYLENPDATETSNEDLQAELKLPIDEFLSGSEEVIFQINLPLSAEIHERVTIRPKQPTFLNRTEYQTLLEKIVPFGHGDEEQEKEPSEYILNTIESVRSSLQALLVLKATKMTSEDDVEVEEKDTDLIRVWFWLPSLSTREKRDDMVNFAKEVGLTGFVLAGKPGILCVEGTSTIIDKYMSRIKSESWSDIPKHHKKITERLRRPLIDTLSRAFIDMKEITNIIPHYGQYNHRGDMSEVKRLMDQWGVGDDFGAVVMNSGS